MTDAFGAPFGDAFGCGGGCGCARCKGSLGATAILTSGGGALKAPVTTSSGTGGFNPAAIMSLIQSGVQVVQGVAPLFQKVPTATTGLVPVAPVAPPPQVYAPPPPVASSSWIGPAIGVGAFALFGGILTVVLLTTGGKKK